MENKNRKQIARIENILIEKGHYKLSAIEQKVLLFLITKVNPNKEKLYEILIPLSEIEDLLMGEEGKYRRANYKRLKEVFLNLAKTVILFPTDVNFQDINLEGGISILQSYTPMKIDGRAYIEILFSEKLTPFLIQLKHYVQINILEVAPMRSGHAIRLFQTLKAAHNRFKLNGRTSELKYSLVDLKLMLGIENKYSEFKQFNQWVLKKATEEINANTSLKIIEIKKSRNSKRQVVELIFICADQTSTPIIK